MAVLFRLLGYLKPYWTTLCTGYLFLLAAIAAQLAAPQLTAWAIDTGIAKHRPATLAIATVAILLAGLAQGALTYSRSYAFQALAERIAARLREELYAHLLCLSPSFFDVTYTGQLMARLTEDISAIRRFFWFSPRVILQSGATLTAIAIVLFSMDARLAALTLGFVPFLAIATGVFSATMRHLYLAVQQQFGVVTTRLQENLAGVRVVRAFARETWEIDRFAHELDSLQRLSLRVASWSAGYTALAALLGSSGTALLLWYGGHEVLAGRLTVGKLTAFYFFALLTVQPVRLLGSIVSNVARAIAAGRRIFEVLDTAPTIQSPANGKDASHIRGAVEFRHVVFHYDPQGPPSLLDVDFAVPPGAHVALVGPTGSGKTTVTALIPRLYDPTEGAVLIDGVDVREYDLASLRRAIAVVQQEPLLFAMSIRENIAFGRPDATEEEIIEAARLAQAHDFIMVLPDGYNSLVGERGVSLSGGQKQRIALARAILMNPRILILDEATSSVDAETDSAIQAAIATVLQGRTAFIIAHRLSTLEHADIIFVMDHGRIVERGTHAELLARGGLYARLYFTQQAEQDWIGEGVEWAGEALQWQQIQPRRG
jgi:ABC-type multidrug transport system fused ATPase/permease subunit